MGRSLPVVVAALVLACSAKSEAPRAADSATTPRSSDADAVRRFVREFYDWYVPLANAPGSAIDRALKARPAAFDTTLARELTEDVAAQAKVKGELVGLDFDPVLASQDPCPRYEVGYIEVTTTTYNVHVTPTCDRAAGPEPRIVTEVATRSGGFAFVNFRYPLTKTDLRTELARLRASRIIKP
jgi:hypothetical protein